MPINDRQLRYFVKVVEVGNMTKAAALLHVAQPALGIQIRQLEDLLGTPLFERHSRGVSVTPAGQLLYERAGTVLRLMDEAEAELKAFGQDRRETLTVGVTHSIMRLVGSAILTAARRDLPGVFLSLVEEPSIVLELGLQRGEIDLAFIYELAPETPSITGTPVMVEELLLVTRPDQAPEAETVPFADVAGMELVLAHARDPIRRLVEQAALDRALTIKVDYEVQSLQATRQVVQEGLAASILPYGTVAEEIASGRLASRRIADPVLKRTLFLARPTGRGAFLNEDGIMKLMRSVVKQLAVDLEHLAERPEA